MTTITTGAWTPFLSMKHVMQALVVPESPIRINSRIREADPGTPFLSRDATRADEWPKPRSLNYEDLIRHFPARYEVWLTGENEAYPEENETLGDLLSRLSGHDNTGHIEDFLDYIHQQLSDATQPAEAVAFILRRTVETMLGRNQKFWYYSGHLPHKFFAYGDAAMRPAEFAKVKGQAEFAYFFQVLDWTAHNEETSCLYYRFMDDVRAEEAKHRTQQEQEARLQAAQHVVLPREQFLPAWVLAKHFHHTWADSIAAAVMRGHIDGWTAHSVDEAVLWEDYYPEFGATILTVDENGTVVHTTTTKRFSWRISPDGAITAWVSRPDHPQAITISISADMYTIQVQWEADVPLYERHYSAARWFLSALFPRVRLERNVLAPLAKVILREEEVGEEENS